MALVRSDLVLSSMLGWDIPAEEPATPEPPLELEEALFYVVPAERRFLRI